LLDIIWKLLKNKHNLTQKDLGTKRPGSRWSAGQRRIFNSKKTKKQASPLGDFFSSTFLFL
jgi:hypothetical protein